jgi:hypothetical protein
MSIDLQNSNAPRATNGSPVSREKNVGSVALLSSEAIELLTTYGKPASVREPESF